MEVLREGACGRVFTMPQRVNTGASFGAPRPPFDMLKHNLLLSHPFSSIHTTEEQTTEQEEQQREAQQHAAGLGDDSETRSFRGKNLVIAD